MTMAPRKPRRRRKHKSLALVRARLFVAVIQGGCAAGQLIYILVHH